MNRSQNGFGIVGVLILFVSLAALSGVGFVAYNRLSDSENSKNTSQTNSDTESTQTASQPVFQTMNLESAPIVAIKHDSSWSRLTEFGYPRDGLTKTIDGVAFLISFTRTPLEYDYMDRSAGGAYPPGKLYKEIIANGKPHYIGTVEGTVNVDGAFLSTCMPSSNGACSLFLPQGYKYMIVDLNRHNPTESDYKGTSPLILSDVSDQKAVSEFADIMTTLTY